MICKRCGSEMRPTFAHRYMASGLETVSGYECLKCGMLYIPSSDEWEDMRADPVGDDEDDEPPDPYGGHVGFYAEADGEPFHVLGDLNMSEKTLNALREVVRAAKRAIERGDFDKKEED